MIHYAWIVAFTGTLVLLLTQGFARMSYSVILPSRAEEPQGHHLLLRLGRCGERERDMETRHRLLHVRFLIYHLYYVFCRLSHHRRGPELSKGWANLRDPGLVDLNSLGLVIVSGA